MKCKSCNKTPNEVSFYKSIATYCKEHWRAKVSQNRLSKIDYYKQFDKERANHPDRVRARKRYAKTNAGKEAHKRSMTKYRHTNPERRSAHVKLGNAVRDGRVLKWPVCELPECNLKPEAHHPDYSQPLSVVWLCPAHHKQAHALIKSQP